MHNKKLWKCRFIANVVRHKLFMYLFELYVFASLMQDCIKLINDI